MEARVSYSTILVMYLQVFILVMLTEGVFVDALLQYEEVSLSVQLVSFYHECVLETLILKQNRVRG